MVALGSWPSDSPNSVLLDLIVSQAVTFLSALLPTCSEGTGSSGPLVGGEGLGESLGSKD